MKLLKTNEKTIACLVLLIAVLVLLPSPGVAGEAGDRPGVQVFINQIEIQFTTPPLLEEGRVVVPLRAILEVLGSEVHWDEENKRVMASYRGRTITIYLEDSLAEIDGESIDMNPPASVVQGTTMVPLRFLTEGMGLEVNWNAEKLAAEIKTGSFVPYTRVQPGYLDELPENVATWMQRKQDTSGVDARVHDGILYILATFGLKESGGYAVRILSIEREQDHLLVSVEYTVPSPGQYTFPAFTRPFDLGYIDFRGSEMPLSVRFQLLGDRDQVYSGDEDAFSIWL